MAKGAAIKVTGLKETLRGLSRIPPEAKQAIRKQSYEIAQSVAAKAGSGATSQAAPLVRNIRPANDRIPTITFGGNARSGLSGNARLDDLLGANFGTNGRYKQFPPKRSPDYYVYATIKANGDYIIETWTKAVDDIVTAFEAG